MTPSPVQDPNPRRLHMGCGLTYLEGWINCDGAPSARLFTLLPKPLRSLLRRAGLVGRGTREFWRFLEAHPITYVNARKRWPFASESVAIVYSSHVIDCFSGADREAFLQEAFRVLKPGGEIRLAGMDLARQVASYGQTQDARRLVALVSYPHPQENGLLTRLRHAFIPALAYRAQLDVGAYKTLLETAGFREVVPLQPGETTLSQPHPINLWQRHGESLYVEARKPQGALSRDA
ncbi:MAG: methyltransferase domain-containing protein [Cyanobacteriota bacterium]|nr:methyltransferase domain-containing protein [Cyanobacteriota bacterium]